MKIIRSLRILLLGHIKGIHRYLASTSKTILAAIERSKLFKFIDASFRAYDTYWYNVYSPWSNEFLLPSSTRCSWCSKKNKKPLQKCRYHQLVMPLRQKFETTIAQTYEWWLWVLGRICIMTNHTARVHFNRPAKHEQPLKFQKQGRCPIVSEADVSWHQPTFLTILKFISKR